MIKSHTLVLVLAAFGIGPANASMPDGSVDMDGMALGRVEMHRLPCTRRGQRLTLLDVAGRERIFPGNRQRGKVAPKGLVEDERGGHMGLVA